MANLSANVTNKTVADFYREALPVHREMVAAQEVVPSVVGKLRTIYKRAKDSGVSEKAIARLLKEGLLDPEEVTKDLHDYVRARAIIGAMPKEQMEMFVDLMREEADEETKITMDRERVYDDGYFVGDEAKNRETNPHPPGSDFYDIWDRAWLAAQAKRVESMAPKKRGRPAKPKTGDQDTARA